MEQKKLPHDHHTGSEHTLAHLPAIGEFQVIADAFKILSDPTRARLFWILCHCEECVLNLSAMMEMSSPALSHHLKHLKAVGLISSRREGKEVYYRATDNTQTQALHQMMETMAAISCPTE